MTEEGRVRRKALKERLKAKRRAKETEFEKRGAGERERCDLDAGLTCLEELEAEVRGTTQIKFAGRRVGLEHSIREMIHTRFGCLKGEVD